MKTLSLNYSFGNLAFMASILSEEITKIFALLNGEDRDTDVVETPRLLTTDQLNGRLSPDDPVIGIEINGEARAYPVKWLPDSKIIKDIIGCEPVVISYGDGFGKSFAFSARAKIASLRPFFPKQMKDDPLLYDFKSMRLVRQATGEIVIGSDKGQQLPMFPIRIVPWVTWETLHPKSKVYKQE